MEPSAGCPGSVLMCISDSFILFEPKIPPVTSGTFPRFPYRNTGLCLPRALIYLSGCTGQRTGKETGSYLELQQEDLGHRRSTCPLPALPGDRDP